LAAVAEPIERRCGSEATVADNPTLEDDIRRLAEQERLLQFARFGPAEAWALGSLVREIGVRQNAPIAIDVSFRDRTLFHCAMPGSTTDNAEWIRRKRNTVLRLWRSSYAVGRALALSGTTQEAAYMLPAADYAVHGGGFPILLGGAGCIGAITVSGLPQRDDHILVADALAMLLKIDLSTCRLAAEHSA
jgi:uncharacterized protein (UPF0303 family)